MRSRHYSRTAEAKGRATILLWGRKHSTAKDELCGEVTGMTAEVQEAVVAKGTSDRNSHNSYGTA